MSRTSLTSRTSCRSLATAAGLVAGLVLTSCGISAESAPRDIEKPTQSQDEDEPQGQEAGGSGQIFLVQPDAGGGPTALVSVARSTGPSVGADPSPVLDVLFDGPNASEMDSDITTVLPAGMTLVDWSVRSGRVVTIDLPGEFGDLTGRTLIFALAQIVHTVTAADGVNGVRITIGGEAREWPDVNGQLQSDPLTVYDYPGLLRSTQPPFPAVPSD
jgi:spore germination protein GerM